MTLSKSRTSNYWNHSSEIDTLVNQDVHAASIRSSVHGRTGFPKSGGLRASLPFFPLSHPHPSTFLLSPHFSHGPHAQNSFVWLEFHSLRSGTLATQAIVDVVFRSRLLSLSTVNNFSLFLRLNNQQVLVTLKVAVCHLDLGTEETS